MKALMKKTLIATAAILAFLPLLPFYLLCAALAAHEARENRDDPREGGIWEV